MLISNNHSTEYQIATDLENSLKLVNLSKNKIVIQNSSIINIIFSQHTIEAGMFYYDPQSIEIEIGDTIEWINVAGVHDVNGITNSITGEPFNNPEDFYLPINNGGSLGTIVFNVPGEYNYDCSVGSHAQQGMVGSITVIESNSCDPGLSLIHI